ncbi:hypothetical protein C0992_002765, partial [Termitomyces sp. T32_za158]
MDYYDDSFNEGMEPLANVPIQQSPAQQKHDVTGKVPSTSAPQTLRLLAGFLTTPFTPQKTSVPHMASASPSVSYPVLSPTPHPMLPCAAVQWQVEKQPCLAPTVPVVNVGGFMQDIHQSGLLFLQPFPLPASSLLGMVVPPSAVPTVPTVSPVSGTHDEAIILSCSALFSLLQSFGVEVTHALPSAPASLAAPVGSVSSQPAFLVGVFAALANSSTSSTL